jgi:PleD family two-component response regulator
MGFLPICRRAASMPHPFGLFPTNTPVLDAANGRKARYCATSVRNPPLFQSFQLLTASSVSCHTCGQLMTTVGNAIMSALHKLLFVDDEQDLREIVLEYFGTQYQVSTAENAEAARAVFKNAPPTVAILDVRMLGEDGLSALKSP